MTNFLVITRTNHRQLKHQHIRFRVHNLNKKKPECVPLTEAAAIGWIKNNGNADKVYQVFAPDATLVCQLSMSADNSQWRDVALCEAQEEEKTEETITHTPNVQYFSSLKKAATTARKLTSPGDIFRFDLEDTLFSNKALISPTARLFWQLAKANVSIVIVTGRPENQRHATVNQLIKQRLNFYEFLSVYDGSMREKTTASVAEF